MLRTATTTGAERYEDKSTGLVWVNIPAKSMLLDSKKEASWLMNAVILNKEKL